MFKYFSSKSNIQFSIVHNFRKILEQLILKYYFCLIDIER